MNEEAEGLPGDKAGGSLVDMVGDGAQGMKGAAEAVG